MADRERLEIEIEASGMITGRRVAVRELDAVGGAAGRAGGGLSRFDTILGGVGRRLAVFAATAALAGAALGGIVVRQAIAASRQYEDLRARLITVTGAQEKANAVFADLEKFAAKTPFQLTEITDAYIVLATQGIYPTERQLVAFGNTAAAMGRSIGDYSNAITRAIVGEFESLKTFGIQAKSQGDQVVFTFKGVSTTVAKESTAIIDYLTRIGETDFAGGMERQAATLGGAFSNLEDSAVSLANAVGEGGLSREVALLARQLSQAGDDSHDMAKKAGQGLGFMVGAIPIALNGFMAFGNAVVGTLAAVVKTISGAIYLLGKMSSGPWGLPPEVTQAARDVYDVSSELTDISFDRYSQSVDQMSLSWDALLKRTMAGYDATKKATGGLDDMAASAANAAKNVGDAADSVLKLKASSVTIAQGTVPDLGILDPKNYVKPQAGTTTAAEYLKRIKDATIDASDYMQQAATNFVENIQRSFGEAIFQFARHGEVSFTAMWDTFRDLGLRVISELAAQMATLKLTTAITSPGGSFNAAGLKSLLSSAAPYIAGAAIAAAPIVIANYLNKSRESKRFDSGAYSTFDSKTGSVAVASGIQNRSSNAARDAISGLWRAFQEGTGAFVTGMAGLTIAVRHDQKAFRVSIGGVVLGTFKDLNQAITTGFKAQFDSAEFSQQIAPAIRDFVSGFSGTAEELVQGIGRIQTEIDAGSGLSDLALEIRGLAADARQTAEELAQLGVSRADSQEIAGFSFIERFKELTRSLYGEQLSPEAQLEQQQKAGEIAQAELELMRAQLQARKAYLEGQLAIGQQETQVLQFKLDAEGKGLNVRARLAQAEGETMNQYLNLRGRFAQKQAEAFQAELAAINKVLEALSGLDIDIGKIKIPSIGRSFGGSVSKFGGLVDRFNRGVENFVDAILGARQDTSTSPFTDRERLQQSFDLYQELLSGARSGNVAALEQLPQAYRDLLSLAKDFSGGATGLGFLGLGDSFKEFFTRLEAGALDFTSSGRPKKLFDAELVVPERFFRNQEQQTKELNERRKEAHSQTNKIADAVDSLGGRLEESLERIRQETRTTRKALSLYDSKRTAEAA